MQQILVEGFNKGIAQMLAGSKDRLYIAIGSGDESWDTEGLPDDVPTSTQYLMQERARLPVASIEYLDSEGTVSGIPTPKVKITSGIFTGEEYRGAVRECGLYLTENSLQTMLLYSVFARVDITEQATLTKCLTLTLGSQEETVIHIP